MESIVEVNNKGVEAIPGHFAENLTISGIDLTGLKIGDRFEIKNAEPDGNRPCRIYHQMGSCIMPQEGIFTRTIKQGRISLGDLITLAE